MTTCVAWIIAGVSTAVCLILWFREAGRIMRERKSTVDSAAAQLEICRRRAQEHPADGEAAAVYRRSEDIYRQAQYQYRQCLCRPWIALPAFVLGYRTVEKEDPDFRGGSGT